MISVAIDGPAGAGKSTIARMIAKKMGYIYMDTGALYRAIGLCCLRLGVNGRDAETVTALLPEIKVSLEFIEGEQRVLMNGEDVSDQIRTEAVSMMASRVSAIPEVRRFLLDLQRDFAREHNVIMDGRDIGTVVLPQAQVKIFLTASPEARAARRERQLTEKGIACSYEAILSDIRQRDYNDSHRETAPLKPAPDAVLVDTTEWTLEESAERIETIIKETLA